MELQKIIDKTYCPATAESLDDRQLLSIYKIQPSVLRKHEQLKEILLKTDITSDQMNTILNEFVLKNIPAGVKSVVRGSKFNYIVMQYLMSLKCLQHSCFQLEFESTHPSFVTSEIPDFYIYNTLTGKCLIGMNQIDLWTGGHQLNRGMRYINYTTSSNQKLVCIIAKYTNLTNSVQTKKYKLFKTGFETNTLCYLNGLEDIITNFFSIQSTGFKRTSIDKFYTQSTIAFQCVQYFRSFYTPLANDLMIEPSAGSGVFLPLLRKCSPSSTIVSYDILPDHSDIIQQDFLLLDVQSLVKKYNDIYVIGNPPFGRSSSLARQFIKKAATFAKVIAFILPKSFKKPSIQQSVPLNFHLEFQADLPENSFVVNGEDYCVPCVFQIWTRRDELRLLPVRLVPTRYAFCKKNENPSIALRRVGVNAGHCFSTDLVSKSSQSHYFIKFEGMTIDTFLTKYSTIIFDRAVDTVGPKSISKQEFIEKLNELF